MDCVDLWGGSFFDSPTCSLHNIKSLFESLTFGVYKIELLFESFTSADSNAESFLESPPVGSYEQGVIFSVTLKSNPYKAEKSKPESV